MSSSPSVRDKLSGRMPGARHCQIVGTAAILSLCDRVKISAPDRLWIETYMENVAVTGKYSILLKKTFNTRTDVSVRSGMNYGRSRIYIVAVREHEEALRVLQAVGFINTQGEAGESPFLIQNVVLQNAYCKQTFIRGASLTTGSISAPEKFCHFEIVYPTESKAEQLKNIITTFDIKAEIVPRKRYYVVYIEGGSRIVDILNVMEAPVPLMELENIRIVKEMRGSVNRQVNCETVNISKIVSATVKQIEDTRFTQSVAGPPGLPGSLQEVTHIRLEWPEATLRELGKTLEPPVGESGVNHRLRKLSLAAEELW